MLTAWFIDYLIKAVTDQLIDDELTDLLIALLMHWSIKKLMPVYVCNILQYFEHTEVDQFD